MSSDQIPVRLQRGLYNSRLELLYPNNSVRTQITRWTGLVSRFQETFGTTRPVRLFSAPGRTELGGNHTDHQNGRVLAAAVDLDVICAAAPNSDQKIRIHSEDYGCDEIDLNDLQIHDSEVNQTAALIRGIAARCRSLGYRVEGFDAFTASSVLRGSGLSSSAAFEVAVGTMIGGLFNNGAISAVEIAMIGRYAENVYFGKPCGLMDQAASSVGGLIAIDFQDPNRPVVESVAFSFQDCGYTLCIVDTRGDHADLTEEYAAIETEMSRIAGCFGAASLREVDPERFSRALPELRRQCGDRPVLRAMHFFSDNERVTHQVQALKEQNFSRFLSLVVESGRSSFCYLQNVYPARPAGQQGLSLALAVSEQLLSSHGAWRVHGGGFAGTIQAFVPDSMLDRYKAEMDRIFGPGACMPLAIRPVGGTELIAEEE